MTKHRGELSKVFLAIRTSDVHSASFDTVRTQMPCNGSWEIAQSVNDHISLAFLGTVANKKLDRLFPLLRDFAKNTEAFPLEFNGIYTFSKVPVNGRPYPDKEWKVLYAQPDPAAAGRLQDIHTNLAYRVLQPNGYEFGDVKTPHNTMAKVYDLKNQRQALTDFIEEHGRMTTPVITCGELSLLSHLDHEDERHPRNGGLNGKYEILETFWFRGNVL